MSLTTKHLALLLLVAIGVSHAPAQEHAPPLRREPSSQFGVDLDFVYGASLKAGNANFGPMRSLTAGISYLTPVGYTGRWEWDAGFVWKRREVKYRVNPGAPNALQVISAPIVASFEASELSTLAIKVSPGIYSDMYDIGLSDINAPLGIRFYHEYHPEFLWYLGAQVNIWHEFPVIPDAGFRWQFWYDWTLDMNLTNPRVEYEFRDNWIAFAGAQWLGEAYNTSDDLAQSNGRPGTGDTSLTYRDIRIQAGLRYHWDEESHFLFAAGYSLQRQLKFDGGDLQLKTGGAPFVQAVLNSTW
ncbi:MAG: DUF6268 family outer membrane beta-barrel protein [Limisphaerales bacterium]